MTTDFQLSPIDAFYGSVKHTKSVISHFISHDLDDAAEDFTKAIISYYGYKRIPFVYWPIAYIALNILGDFIGECIEYVNSKRESDSFFEFPYPSSIVGDIAEDISKVIMLSLNAWGTILVAILSTKFNIVERHANNDNHLLHLYRVATTLIAFAQNIPEYTKINADADAIGHWTSDVVEDGFNQICSYIGLLKQNDEL